MNSSGSCPNCGRPRAGFAADAFLGSCPRCLVAFTFQDADRLGSARDVPGTPARIQPMTYTSARAFLDALRQTSLLNGTQLKEIEMAAAHRSLDGARELAQYLLQHDLLSAYQVNQVLQGHATELIRGPYIILERLGTGVMGQVFKARHQTMNRLVALKIIRPELLADPTAVRWFYREVQAAAQLSHPHVVHAFDAGPVDQTHFLAMEYVEGIDLARLVKRSGPLPVAEACAYIHQAALGLQAIADHGLVHRDVKPANLFVSQAPAQDPAKTGAGLPPGHRSAVPGQLKILDLGLARLQRATEGDATSQLSAEGSVLGTPDYLAPEQALDAHVVDIRADLYSLGCTFYFLLTGQPHFPGGSLAQKLEKHRAATPLPVERLRPKVPANVSAVVCKLLAKRPEDRYQTPAEVARLLTRSKVVSTSPSTAQVQRPRAPNDSPPAMPRKRGMGRTAPFLWVAGAVVLAGAIMVWLVVPWRKEERAAGHGKAPSTLAAPSAEAAIVERAIQAHGGLAALQKFKATIVKAKGKQFHGSAFAGNLTSTVWAQPPTFLRTETTVEVNGQTVSSTIGALNHDSGWISERGDLKPVPKKWAADAQHDGYCSWLATLAPLKDPAFRFTGGGEIKLNGETAVNVRVSSPGHPDVTLSFGRTSGLLLRGETIRRAYWTDQGKQTKIQTEYSNHKLVQGVQVPGRLVGRAEDGDWHTELEVVDYQLLERLIGWLKDEEHDYLFVVNRSFTKKADANLTLRQAVSQVEEVSQQEAGKAQKTAYDAERKSVRVQLEPGEGKLLLLGLAK